jgi:hypothetical protein
MNLRFIFFAAKTNYIKNILIKQLTFYAVIIILFISSCSKNNLEINTEPEDSIKSAVRHTYNYSSHITRITDTYLSYLYNEKKQLIEITEKGAADDYYITSINYNNKGYKISQVITQSSGAFLSSLSFIYDEMGKLIKEIENPEYRLYSYDSLCRLHQITTYNYYTTGVESTTLFEYSSLIPNRVEYENFYDSDSILRYELEYRYNNKGLLIEKNSIDGDYGGMFNEYAYNAKNQLIWEKKMRHGSSGTGILYTIDYVYY